MEKTISIDKVDFIFDTNEVYIKLTIRTYSEEGEAVLRMTKAQASTLGDAFKLLSK